MQEAAEALDCRNKNSKLEECRGRPPVDTLSASEYGSCTTANFVVATVAAGTRSTHARRECGLHEMRHSWRGWSVHRACKRVRQLCGALQAGGRLALRVRKKREQPTKRERPTRDDSLLLRSAGHKRVRQLAVRHTAHSWPVGSSRARIVRARPTRGDTLLSPLSRPAGWEPPGVPRSALHGIDSVRMTLSKNK